MRLEPPNIIEYLTSQGTRVLYDVLKKKPVQVSYKMLQHTEDCQRVAEKLSIDTERIWVGYGLKRWIEIEGMTRDEFAKWTPVVQDDGGHLVDPECSSVV